MFPNLNFIKLNDYNFIEIIFKLILEDIWDFEFCNSSFIRRMMQVFDEI